MAAIRKKTVPAAAKTTVSKVEEPKTEVKTTELKKAETPTTPVKTEEAKKEVKTENVKTAEKAAKKTAAKTAKKTAAKTAEKKTTAKTASAKKAELKSQVCVQFDGKSYTEEELVKIAKDVWQYDLKQKAGDLTSVELYVKPEESMVYYVMNKEVAGSFSI